MAYRLNDIADLVVVVTGASSGIGLATTYEATNRGACTVAELAISAFLASGVKGSLQ